MKFTVLFILVCLSAVFAIDTNTVKHVGDVVSTVAPQAKPFIDLLTTAVLAMWSLVLYLIAHRHGLSTASRILKITTPGK